MGVKGLRGYLHDMTVEERERERLLSFFGVRAIFLVYGKSLS